MIKYPVLSDLAICNTKEELVGLVLACSYTAGEFADEDLDAAGELVPEFITGGKYYFDDSEPMYKHQWWATSESIDKLNNLLKSESIDKLNTILKKE